MQDQPTYYELFDHYISKYEQENTDANIAPETQAKRSYSLYEDLKLIIACSTLEEVHNKDFKLLEDSRIVARSQQSIRDRFRQFLTKLAQSDLERIVAHLKLHGVHGYLHFTSSPTNKQLLEITLQDPKNLPHHQERRAGNDDAPDTQKKIRLGEEDFQVVEPAPKHKRKQKVTQLFQTVQDNTFPRNALDKFQPDQLEQMLELLAEWKKVPKGALVTKLHQLSANIPDLDDYLMSQNDKHCWFEEEDQLLAQAQTKTCAEIRLLLRLKGVDRVRRRLRYLGMKLPFELE